MLENGKNTSISVSEAQDEALKCLALCTTQRYSVYCHRGVKKPDNSFSFCFSSLSSLFLEPLHQSYLMCLTIYKCFLGEAGNICTVIPILSNYRVSLLSGWRLFTLPSSVAVTNSYKRHLQTLFKHHMSLYNNKSALISLLLLIFLNGFQTFDLHNRYVKRLWMHIDKGNSVRMQTHYIFIMVRGQTHPGIQWGSA